MNRLSVFRIRRFVLVFAIIGLQLCLCVISTASGAYVYVSPAGDAANSGTETAPFLRIEKLPDTNRGLDGLPEGLPAGGVKVVLREGVCAVTDSNVFTAADSGPADGINQEYGQRLSIEKLRAWKNLKYGMFIHFGMSTYLGQELPDGKAPIDTYAPTDLDVAQWVTVAKEAGMNYAVLTAKHVAGHCLWPSELTEYDVANNEENTDVVGAFVKECRKQGILPGLYYCSWDNHHDFFSLMPDKTENYAGALITPREEDLKKSPPPYTTSLYQNFMTAQIDELLELYSPLVEFWIDIPIILGNGYREFIYNHITEKYPEMLVIMNHGLIKQSAGGLVFKEDKAWPTDVLTLERYFSDTPYNPVWTIKGKEIYLPAESCLPIGKEWFWEEDDMAKPLDDLVKILESSLENRVNLLLNVPPDTTGKIPEKWVKPLMELKQKMRTDI